MIVYIFSPTFNWNIQTKTETMKNFSSIALGLIMILFLNPLKSCDNLTLNYTFDCAAAGDIMNVTWTSTGCDAAYTINISLLSLTPFTTVQSLNNNTNDGSEMFTIGTHPPGMYQFYIQVSSGQGTCDPVGYYTYGPQFEIKEALPVSFSSFKVKAQEQTSLLSWSTDSEVNNKGFEILRSTDTKHWDSIGFLEGQHTSSERKEYLFYDISPEKDVNYYRLKQLDNNGNYTYSEMLAISHKQEKIATIRVFPNPCIDQIRVFTEQEGNSYELISTSGQTILQGWVENNTINVSNLARGTYYLRVTGIVTILPIVKL